jgi:hypothetical protein
MVSPVASSGPEKENKVNQIIMKEPILVTS